MKDLYNILGINDDASKDEIKRAYRKLSLKHHPDKGGNNDVFAEINEAFNTLYDDNERRNYDIKKKMMGKGGDFQNIPFGNDIFNMMFSGMNMGTNHPNIRIFRNGVPVTQNNLNKPPPIIKNIKITIEQSYRGDKIPINIQRWIKEDGEKVFESETLYVDIPMGIDNNEIIILRNKGHILNENNKGDIKIIIELINNTLFKRKGLDLIFNKTITLKEALCGFEFKINHINNKSLLIKNKNYIIKNNYIKILDGLGMKRENNIGRLIIEFNIEFPDTLTDEQVETLEKIL